MEASTAAAAAAAETPTSITSLNDDIHTTQEFVEEVPLESQAPLVDEEEVGVDVSLNKDEGAAAETPTTITTLNDDDTTTQGSVEELLIETRIPPVDEGEVGVVTTLNENDEDVHATMASTLPPTVIIQSNQNHRYLRFDGEYPRLDFALRFDGDYSFGLETRYALVPSTNSTGLFHIRSLYNNRFWVHIGGTNRWITARSTEPEEDQSRANCTLFQPIFPVSNSNRVLRLRHVNTGFYVRRANGFTGGLYIGALTLRPKQQPSDKTDEFTFLDWKDVAVLPD
ncbi:hypothetical protein MKX03_035016, partial [Papaver bracteatum]